MPIVWTQSDSRLSEQQQVSEMHANDLLTSNTLSNRPKEQLTDKDDSAFELTGLRVNPAEFSPAKARDLLTSGMHAMNLCPGFDI